MERLEWLGFVSPEAKKVEQCLFTRDIARVDSHNLFPTAGGSKTRGQVQVEGTFFSG